MAVRQYIGARYVPRFMGTYDPTQIYDALDVVDNGSGTSYIARKTVPAGTPLTNTEHWFVYGASSGAIIQLQNDVISLQNSVDDINTNQLPAINNDINDINTNKIPELSDDIVDNIGGYAGDDIKKKHFLLMGDSYLRGTICTSLKPETYTRNYSDGWGYKAMQLLGVDSAHNEAIITGGASFSLAGADHWQDTIQTYAPSQDPEEIDTILLLGGANDRYSNATDIRSGIDAFFINARAKYPNAKIIIGFIGFKRSGSELNGQIIAFNAYKNGCINNGGIFISGLENIAQNAALMGIDGLHPVAAGYTAIAEQVANVLRGSNVDYYARHAIDATSAVTGATIDTLTDALCVLNNDHREVYIPSITFRKPDGMNITLTPLSSILIANIVNCDMCGNPSNPVVGSAVCFVVHGDVTTTFPVIVTLNNSQLYITIMEYGSGSWLNYPNVTAIGIRGIKLFGTSFS